MITSNNSVAGNILAEGNSSRMGMEINLLAFGQIAEITGNASLKISGINDTVELRKNLVVRFPVIASVEYAMAVNRKIITENITLNDHDEVALLPPFSGG